MKDLGMILGVLIVPPVVLPVLIAVALFGMFVFLPFLPPLLGEFMAGSASSVDADKRRAKRRHRVILPLGGKLHGHGLTHA